MEGAYGLMTFDPSDPKLFMGGRDGEKHLRRWPDEEIATGVWVDATSTSIPEYIRAKDIDEGQGFYFWCSICDGWSSRTPEIFHCPMCHHHGSAEYTSANQECKYCYTKLYQLVGVRSMASLLQALEEWMYVIEAEDQDVPPILDIIAMVRQRLEEEENE
jgi:hypothetical protein